MNKKRKSHLTPSDVAPQRWDRRFRAQTIPDRRKKADKRACRKRSSWDEG